MNALLALRDELPDSLFNPAPEDVSFVEMSSEDELTLVKLSENHANSDAAIQSATEAQIALTLLQFDNVEKVQIRTEGYQSAVYNRGDLEEKRSSSTEYVIVATGDWTPVVAVNQYNLNILHKQDMEDMPCFCGCGGIGHLSNADCYFSEDGKSSRQLDQHAEYCQVCLDVTDMYTELKAQGKTIQEIRHAVDEVNKAFIPADTPYSEI